MKEAARHDIIETDATIWHLAMNAPPVCAMPELPGMRFDELVRPVAVPAYREIYATVGEAWNWLDRIIMSDEELERRINDADTHIWLMLRGDERAGFAEFVVRAAETEILYFGLFPDCVGSGLGRSFLRWCIARAWAYGRPRVALNTCSLDHPAALPLYRSEGFSLERTERAKRWIRRGQC